MSFLAMHLLTPWIFATCFNCAAYTGRSAWDCCELSGGCFCLDAVPGLAAWTLIYHCWLILFLFLCRFLDCWWGFGVCSWICRQSAAFFIAPPQGERVPHRSIDVLCGYMCGVCRLCADILCPLRLLWLLYPVHWGSALPLPGGHLAVLCWHGIILWMWARSADPNRSPRRDLLCPQCSGFCSHGVFVSDSSTHFLFFLKELFHLLMWLTCQCDYSSIKYFQYVIYGLASFFFLYGILLLAEGFYTTSAVKQTFGEFRSTQCGRCLSLTVRTRVGEEGGMMSGHWCWMLVCFSPLTQWSPLCFCSVYAELCFTVDHPTETSGSTLQSLWSYVLHFSFQQFIIVTYILAFIWLAVFAFTAIPVFFLFNMEQTCHNINILAETTPSINQHGWICMDARQYGVLFL